MTAISEGGRSARDGKPGINGPANPLETRRTEVSLLDRAIRLKISQQDPEHKRRGKDNRSWAASLQVDITTPIERGLIQSFGGELPPDPQLMAQLRLVAEPHQSSIYFEVSSGVIDALPIIWNVTINADGRESWSYGSGEKRHRLKPRPEASINMRRIVEQSAHPEKTVDSYKRVIDKWADIANWDEMGRQLMHNALKLAEKYLGKEKRKSGEPYIEHLWETARQMWVWGIRDVNELAAALMHDIPEDSLAFKPRKDEVVSHWQRRVVVRLEQELGVKKAGHQAAYLTMMMSRPPKGVTVEELTFKFKPDGSRIYRRRLLTDEERNNLYYEQIGSSQSVRKIKIPDRTHNTRTLWAMPDANITATYWETKVRYPKLIARIRQEDPVLARKMERDLMAALSEYESLALVQA
jgi:hypothetical protein